MTIDRRTRIIKGMDKILVVGASNIDVNYYLSSLPKGGESAHTVSPSVSSLGGKGLNQAVASARAQGDVAFITSVGDDEDGRKIEEALRKEYMSLYFKEACFRSTGKAIILNESDGENEVIVDSGANALLDVDFLSGHDDLFEKSSFVLMQNEMPFSSNEWILRNYGESKRIFYNPSPLGDIPKELYRYIDTLLVNEMEACALSGLEEPTEAAKALLSYGAKNVLMTRGKKGSTLFKKDSMIETQSFKADVVDTVGAGDTYAGYYVACLASGYSEEKALLIASAAASLSVQKKGAFASIPRLDDVLKII